MLQIVQYQKSGEVKVEELPVPQCPKNGVIIEVRNSLISAGTERTSVDNAKGSLISRAKKQPDQVKVVLDAVKSYGLKETTRRVKAKLNSFKLLGYSAAGIVKESDTDNFKPGDRVAAAGAGFANHSEVIAVPKNLVVKLPDSVSFEDAAYTTVGAIAMQGFRQAKPVLGDKVVVVGLGLLGLITVQLLKAAGCYVIGMDVNENSLKKGKEFGCDLTLKSSSDNTTQVIANTNGFGADATIITASTSSNEPLQMSMEMTRKKGKVVIVGAIGMDLKRNPFYKKEIDLRISSSYGPGRYDALYEEQGIDYPYAFVRWTENRNMQAFLDLIAEDKMNVKDMTTHNFDIQNSPDAYKLITDNSEPYLGILINYPERDNKYITNVKTENKSSVSDVNIGFIGAGQFAQNYILPPLSNEQVNLHSVVNASSASAKTVSENFDFSYAGTSPDDVLNNNEINTVFIATRHDSHASLVQKALENGKNVFVEKPLALNLEELNKIQQAFNKSDASLMVGFNRRFSDSFTKIKDFLKSDKQPMTVKYRVNAGTIPADHWVQTEQGGGRIIGEACHFIDIMHFLTESMPVRVFAESLSARSEADVSQDTVIATIKFTDGSVGILEYLSNGDKGLSKEYCEVFCGNKIAIMDNFEELRFYSGGSEKLTKSNGEKGIKKEVKDFISSLKTNTELISSADLFSVTKVTFAILESLKTGNPVEL